MCGAACWSTGGLGHGAGWVTGAPWPWQRLCWGAWQLRVGSGPVVNKASCRDTAHRRVKARSYALAAVLPLATPCLPAWPGASSTQALVCSRWLQERLLVDATRWELLAMVGLFGSAISGAQVSAPPACGLLPASAGGGTALRQVSLQRLKGPHSQAAHNTDPGSRPSGV